MPYKNKAKQQLYLRFYRQSITGKESSLRTRARALKRALDAGEITQEQHDRRWRNLLDREKEHLLTNTRGVK